jgi:hypothetical protein
MNEPFRAADEVSRKEQYRESRERSGLREEQLGAARIQPRSYDAPRDRQNQERDELEAEISCQSGSNVPRAATGRRRGKTEFGPEKEAVAKEPQVQDKVVRRFVSGPWSHHADCLPREFAIGVGPLAYRDFRHHCGIPSWFKRLRNACGPTHCIQACSNGNLLRLVRNGYTGRRPGLVAIGAE